MTQLPIKHFRSSTSHPNKTRRKLLMQCGAISVLGLPATQLLADGHNKVPLNDPQAVALGYVEDASTAIHENYVAGAKCENCSLYAGEAGKPFGPCPIFSNREVSMVGWCSAHVPKS